METLKLLKAGSLFYLIHLKLNVDNYLSSKFKSVRGIHNLSLRKVALLLRIQKHKK